MVPQRGIEPLT